MQRKSRLGLLGCCIIVLLLVLLVVGVEVMDYVTLRPLAQQIGTSPTKGALVEHVTGLLKANMGASREDIHYLLQGVGDGFEFRERGQVGNRSLENVTWTMARTPAGGRIWASWGLFYDVTGRLVEVQESDY